MKLYPKKNRLADRHQPGRKLEREKRNDGKRTRAPGSQGGRAEAQRPS